MIPASFDESDGFLSRPEGMIDEQCDPLSILRAVTPDGLPVVISCWKMTAEELAEVNRTGRVWLGVCGNTMPPCWLAGIKPIGESDDRTDG